MGRAPRAPADRRWAGPALRRRHDRPGGCLLLPVTTRAFAARMLRVAGAAVAVLLLAAAALWLLGRGDAPPAAAGPRGRRHGGSPAVLDAHAGAAADARWRLRQTTQPAELRAGRQPVPAQDYRRRRCRARDRRVVAPPRVRRRAASRALQPLHDRGGSGCSPSTKSRAQAPGDGAGNVLLNRGTPGQTGGAWATACWPTFQIKVAG